MITNLVASIVVSIVTNVSERWPTHAEAVPCPEGRIGCAVLHWGPEIPDKDPTNKWVRTTIKRVTTCKFTWNDKPREVLDEEILSSDEVRYEIKNSWIPIATNQPTYHSVLPGPGIIILTNGFQTNQTWSFVFTNR